MKQRTALRSRVLGGKHKPEVRKGNLRATNKQDYNCSEDKGSVVKAQKHQASINFVSKLHMQEEKRKGIDSQDSQG